MYLVTGSQAKEIDRRTIEGIGVPSMVLMERAACAVADEVMVLASKAGIKNPRVCAVCGSGNNGGDGIAAARILFLRGIRACVYMAAGTERLTGDAASQLKIARGLGVPCLEAADLKTEDILIDAIFGIGLSRPVTGHLADVIADVNAARDAGALVCAVDIPSGIHSDTGAVMGTCVKADSTVTFGYLKLGMVLYPGADHAGHLRCEEIGFDPSVAGEMRPLHETYTEADLGRLPKRAHDGHKGSFGHVLVAAGSRNMAGAAYLSGLAAYRMGSGLVTLFTPECNRVILQQLLPEAVMKTYDEEAPDLALLKDAMAAATVIVLGPGLGRSAGAEKLVCEVLRGAKVPVIADADALNILSEHSDWLKACTAEVIITPHLKELSRLTGDNIQFLKENIEQVCEDFCRQKGVICISKDARTRIFDGTDRIYVNSSGNDGMAVGGSGDVLTGVIAGLIAQGLPAKEAARLGVYIHGMLGDLARKEKGARAMLSSDLPDAIPALMKRVEESVQ